MLLLKEMFPTLWPTFFDDLFSSLKVTNPNQTSAASSITITINAEGKQDCWDAYVVDLFVRVSLAIDDECVNLMIARSTAELTQNTHIKDALKDHVIPHFMQLWKAIVHAALQPSASPAQVPDPSTSLVIPMACVAIRAVGLYSAWIEIQHVVEEAWLTLLYACFQHPALFVDAVVAFTAILAKGMPAPDKLRMLQYLQLDHAMRTITDFHRSLVSSGTTTTTFNMSIDECVVKCLVMIGTELCQAMEDVGNGSDAATIESKNTAMALLASLLPYIDLYFAHKDATVSVHLVPLIGTIVLSVWKKRVQKQGIPLTEPEQAHLRCWLGLAVEKMVYVAIDAEHAHAPLTASSNASLSWLEDEETEEESSALPGVDEAEEQDEDSVVQFMDVRRQLKALIDNIASIAPDLVTHYIQQHFQTTLQAFVAGRGRQEALPVPASKMEALLHLIYVYGEIRSKGHAGSMEQSLDMIEKMMFQIVQQGMDRRIV